MVHAALIMSSSLQSCEEAISMISHILQIKKCNHIQSALLKNGPLENLAEVLKFCLFLLSPHCFWEGGKLRTTAMHFAKDMSNEGPM